MLINESRIIFFTSSLSKVSEEWMRREIRLLSGHIVAIVCFQADINSFEGIPVYELRAERKLIFRLRNRLGMRRTDESQRLNSKSLKNIIAKQKANVLLFQFMTNAVQFSDLIRELPLMTLIQVHGYDVTWDICEYDQPGKKIFSSSYLEEVTRLAEKATILATSEGMQHDLQRQLGTEHIRKYTFGIDLKEKAEVRRESGTLHILFIGRLIDLKGPDRLIEAFILARSQGMKGSLTIIGNGPLYEKCDSIRMESKYSEDVILAGEIPHEDLRIYWENADIVAAHHSKSRITQQKENFGTVFLEAFSWGIPVITTGEGNFTEYVKHDQNSILVEVGDIQAQARAFMELSIDSALLDRLGANARETVRKNYLPGHEYESFKKIIESIS